MDVTLLGTGCPPTNPRRRGPATLLREDNRPELAAYHTGSDDVGGVAAQAGVRTIVLSSLMPGSGPADLAARAARDFSGRIVAGEDRQAV